jgi:hypothetical protein
MVEVTTHTFTGGQRTRSFSLSDLQCRYAQPSVCPGLARTRLLPAAPPPWVARP